MRRHLTTIYKLVAFGLLVAAYWLLGGFEQLGSGWPLAWVLFYLSGGVLMLWAGRKPVGELRPVSFRVLYVLGGSLLMVWALFMMLTTKDYLGKKGRGKTPAAKRLVQ